MTDFSMGLTGIPVNSDFQCVEYYLTNSSQSTINLLRLMMAINDLDPVVWTLLFFGIIFALQVTT